MVAIELINTSTLLAVVSGLALGLSCVLWIKIRRVTKVFNDELKRHKKELQLITQTHMGMGRKFLEMEKQVKVLSVAGGQPLKPEAKTDSGVLAHSSSSPMQPRATSHEHNNDYVNGTHNPENNHGTYNNAVNLFKQGLSADEVAIRCGLSKAEANLMALVNKELSPN